MYSARLTKGDDGGVHDGVGGFFKPPETPTTILPSHLCSEGSSLLLWRWRCWIGAEREILLICEEFYYFQVFGSWAPLLSSSLSLFTLSRKHRLSSHRPGCLPLSFLPFPVLPHPCLSHQLTFLTSATFLSVFPSLSVRLIFQLWLRARYSEI